MQADFKFHIDSQPRAILLQPDKVVASRAVRYNLSRIGLQLDTKTVRLCWALGARARRSIAASIEWTPHILERQWYLGGPQNNP